MTPTTGNPLTQHPLSAAFPAMPEQELEALAIDIEKNGQREPGVLLGGMVLDGWHRYLACQKAGRKFLCGDLPESADPVSFVISRNLHRRHLTASQRASAVVSCNSWATNGKHGSPALVQGMKTSAEMAKEADVGERTIVHAKRAEEAGLGDEVKDGKVSAKAAAEVAALSPAKRAKAVKAIKEGRPPAPKPKAVVASRDVEKLYEAVKAELAETKEKLQELGEVARELEDKLAMFEATEPDEQQKMIADLQKKAQRKDAEIDRQRVQIRDLNNKCNALIQQVKIERKKHG